MKEIFKRNFFEFILLTVFFSGVSPAGALQPVTVKTEVDRSSVYIGDAIKYTITIGFYKGTEVKLPDFGKSMGNFNVKDSGSRSWGFFSRKKIIQWCLLDTYVTGKSTIPKVAVNYRAEGAKEWSQIETSEKEIEVKSLLEKAGSGAKLLDIKGPQGISSRAGYFLVLIIIAVIIIGITSAFFLKNREAQKAVKSRPAHEIAYEQLEALKNRNLIQQGKIKEYYIEISSIIRHYLENRFNLKAPEMTTEEFLTHVRDYSQLVAEHKALLKEFLLACDLVKFAKYIPSEDEINLVFESAKRFIDQTKEIEQEAATVPKI